MFFCFLEPFRSHNYKRISPVEWRAGGHSISVARWRYMQRLHGKVTLPFDSSTPNLYIGGPLIVFICGSIPFKSYKYTCNFICCHHWIWLFSLSGIFSATSTTWQLRWLSKFFLCLSCRDACRHVLPCKCDVNLWYIGFLLRRMRTCSSYN
jgi:hypothetical protein